MRRFSFSLTLFLVLAAVVPAAAAAANLTAESFPATLNGSSTSEHVFTMEEGLAIKCKKASYTGSISEPSSTVSLNPSFSECTAFGFLSATVTTTGCKFTFEFGLETESATFPTTTGVSCEAGKAITITAGTCEVQISTQSGLESATGANSGASEVSLELGISKATYNKTKDGFGCLLNGTGVKEDGALSGNSILSAEGTGLQLITWTYLCKDNLGTKCDPKQVLKPKQAYTGSATDFKIEFQWSDGVNTKSVTVTCKKSSLSGTTIDDSIYVGQHRGSQETPLESFSTQNCSEEKGVECASPVEARKIPTTGYLVAGINGNGGWQEMEFKLKVSCSTANIKFTCYFVNKSMGFNWEGDGTAAKVKWPGVAMSPEKPVTGEENCGKNNASVTGTYTLSIGAFLRKG